MVVVIGRKKPSAKLAPEQYAIEEAHSQALTLTEEQYQNFDVVWAKLGSYPWWPAVLFYSWKAVNDAGLELKTVQQQLVIPPPKTIELEDGKGKKQIHYVLIMFLDKFNCNIIEISPKTICPFSINYDHLVKGKAKTGFKVALARAMRLLHMDQHMTVDELIEIAAIRVQQTPPEYFEIPERSAGVKKQKRSSSKKPTVLQLVEETEDEYEAIPNDDLEDDDDESDYSESKKPSRGKAAKKLKSKPAAKASHDSASKSVNAKKAPTRPKRPNSAVKYLEAIDNDEEESSGDFEVMATSTKAAAKATSSRKKASRKEGRNHHDVITVDDDDGDSHEEFTVQVASQPKASSKLLSKVKSSKSGKAKLTVKAPKDAKKVGAKSKPKKTKTMKTAQSDSEEFTDYHEEPTEPAQPKKSKKSSKRAASPGKIAPSPKEPVQPLTLTPLSTIWTTRVSNQEGDKASGSDERLAYKLDLLWDDTTFTDPQPTLDTIDLEDPSSINARGGMKRQGRSVQQSQIRQSLLTGNLDPHTMVQCEPYLPRGGRQISTVSNRSRGPSPQLEAPYDVVVHPDVVFVSDLHAHLATCEIIGFLGGKWDDATKTLYIQAAFPCRSLVIDGDDGSTDVEMDPGSEIELREIIQNAELEVVGWYHSHPAFAPDPSVRDIENQGNYQQLFQRRKQTSEGRWEVAEPFVGLIVGTYDSRRDSPVGLFRYFHVRGERVSSSSTREISMPYELVPRKREYRSVVADENQTRWRRLPLYISVATILYGANAAFRKAPRLPSDGISLQKRQVLLNGLHDASVHSDDKRKRKLSTGELAAGENGKQKGIKKPRSRRLKALESAPSPLKVSVENAGNGGVEREVIDLMSDPSQTEVEVVKLVIDVNAHEDACEADNSIAVDVEKNTDPSEVPAPTSDMGASSLKTESSTPNKNDQEDVTMCDQDDKRGNDVQITEEIICQSQDSQHDAAQPVLKSPAEMNYPEHISTKNEDETVGPSSSSSQSEHFFNYEASQSQSYSTQSNSQVDESAVQDSSGLTSCTDMDAVYAGVDLYEPDVVTPSDSLNTTQVLKVAVKQDSYSAQADGDDFVSDSAHDSNMHSDGSMHTLDEPVAVVGDEAIKPKDDRTVDSVPLHQSSIQDESGSNSAVSGGVSTPIDPSVLPSGRRRNRKPSTTIRHVDTSDSLVQRSVSSPHSTTSAFVARGPSQVDDADTTSAAPDDDKLKLKAKEGRSGSEEMIWDGVEVIVDDSYAADSVPVPESPVSYDSSVQNHLTSDVVLGTKAEIGEQNQHPSSTPDVDRVIKVDDPANPVDVTVVREINEIADIVDVSQTSDENESMQSDQPIPDHGMRPVFQQLVEDDSMIGGLVCEPLEGCHVTVLRMVASQLKLKIPPTDRRKDGLIRAIRAHQKEAGTASQKPNSEVLDHVHTKGDSNPVDDANLHKPDKELIEASAWEVKHSAVEEEDLTSQAKSPEKHFAVEIRLDAKPVEEDPRGMDAEVLSIAHIQQDDALVVKSEPTEPKVADQKPLKQELKPELESPDVSSNQSLLLAQPEKIEVSHDLSIQEQIDCHLRALRTSYGDGIYGCAEQVITLIDYYRDFDRRTNLNDTWKGKVTKLQKLEASLLADVMLVNVPVALRESFVKDVIGYLRTSWGAALQ